MGARESTAPPTALKHHIFCTSMCKLTPLYAMPPVRYYPHTGVLHVSTAQAHSCMERFEDINSVGAPPIHAVLANLASASTDNSQVPLLFGSNSSTDWAPGQQVLLSVSSTDSTLRVFEEAICLATPPDNPTEDIGGPLREPANARAVVRASAGSPNSNSRSISSSTQAPPLNRLPTGSSGGSTTNSSLLLQEEAVEEEVTQLEMAACQHADVVSGDNNSTSAILRSSEAIARCRRRRLRRMLRTSKEASSSFVALASEHSGKATAAFKSIGSTVASLASFDEEAAASAYAAVRSSIDSISSSASNIRLSFSSSTRDSFDSVSTANSFAFSRLSFSSSSSTRDSIDSIRSINSSRLSLESLVAGAVDALRVDSPLYDEYLAWYNGSNDGNNATRGGVASTGQRVVPRSCGECTGNCRFACRRSAGGRRESTGRSAMVMPVAAA